MRDKDMKKMIKKTYYEERNRKLKLAALVVVLVAVLAFAFIVLSETNIFSGNAPVPKSEGEAQQASSDLGEGIGDVSGLLDDIGQSLG